MSTAVDMVLITKTAAVFLNLVYETERKYLGLLAVSRDYPSRLHVHRGGQLPTSKDTVNFMSQRNGTARSIENELERFF